MNVLSGVVSTVGLGLCLGACNATVGAGGMVSIPKDSANTCAEHCSSIGLSLDAVVIMASNVGCVCRSNKASTATDSSGASGGMAALLIQEQQRQAAQQARH